MKVKDFSYNTDNQAVEEREKLVNLLRNHQYIQEFMNTYDCPFRVVEDNAYKFQKWIQDKDRVSKISKETLSTNPELGAYIDLYYDKDAKVLMDELAYVKASQDIKASYKHLDNYEVFPLNKSLHKAEFSNIDIKNEKPSFMKTMQEVMKFTKGDALGLYIYGNLGVGKSFLAACATNSAAQDNKTVAFVSPSDLLTHLKNNFNKPYASDNTLDTLKSVHLLVIDDLGAEPVSTWGRDEVMLPLLNSRLENFKKTIFTSNYPPNMLEDVYSFDQRGNLDRIRSKRFVDRILAIAHPIELSGENRRRK